MEQKSKISVYNTASRKLEEFAPRSPGQVGIYVCGPTVYDDCHMGHARAVVAFDVVVRWLDHRGYRVRYVRNITDVDDKIIARAAEKGIPCNELAERYIKRFHEDMGKLSLREPDLEPRATEHVGQMVKIISVLCEKGLAYVVDGDVYYAVERFPSYGKLSHRNPEDLLAGARVEVDERKKNPLDFALWKSSSPGEPQWESPWGPGRPGWHIECAAMSSKYLGHPFDLHGGGQDLIFPHHENEIAQFEGATGSPLARYWLHNAHVTVNETKMSKSLGNFFTLREIYERFAPRAVKFFLVRSHYRAPIDFSDGALRDAASGLQRIEEALTRCEEALGRKVAPSAGCPDDFTRAMDRDFNTTEAMGVIFSLVSGINSELDGRKGDWREKVSGQAAAVRFCCELLGVELAAHGGTRVTAAGEEVSSDDVERYLERDSLTEAEIRELVGMRIALRKKKDFALADRIREKIAQMGYEIRDDREGAAGIRKQTSISVEREEE